MIDKYQLDDLRLRSDEKGELARWVIQLQSDLDDERRKSSANQALLAKLEAAEQRVEEMTEQYLDRNTALTFVTLRAEAAEARLLVPVKLPTEEFNIYYGDFKDRGYIKEAVIRVIHDAGFLIEGDSAATIAPPPAGVVMRPQFKKPLERCAAARDGECSHKDCPQIRDNEPMATGRHCPIDNWDDE